MTALSRRERAILTSVVTEFTATREPVGSRTLSKKYGINLSPATIRNVLADLEERGYLSQPHASAGRVPTELAFRAFIDAVLRLGDLSHGDANRISAWFDDAPHGAEMLRGAGRLLSDLTGTAAVLVRSATQEGPLTTVRFIPTRPGELLGVIVLADGTVENRFIQVERTPAPPELERLHNMLGEVVPGRTLSSVRDFFAQKVSEHRDRMETLTELGASLLDATIEVARSRPEVIIEGQALLLGRPEFGTAEQLRDLMRALEEREQIVGLLDRIIETNRVQVFLGGDTESRVGVAVSVVAAPYGADGRPGGALGVIGPLAMDYPTVIPVVSATAEAMSSVLSRGAGLTSGHTRG